jgi:hypothetical protein
MKARPVVLRDLVALAAMVAADPTPTNVTILFRALLAFHCALRIANVIAETKAVVKELFAAQPAATGNMSKARSLICAKHLVFRREVPLLSTREEVPHSNRPRAAAVHSAWSSEQQQAREMVAAITRIRVRRGAYQGPSEHQCRLLESHAGRFVPNR